MVRDVITLNIFFQIVRSLFESYTSSFISRLSKNAHLYDNLNSFQSKILYIVLIFKWSCIWIPIHVNLQFHASVIKHSNRTPTFGKGSCIQKIMQKLQFRYLPRPASKQFLRYRISLTTLKRVVKWAKDTCAVIDKSASSCTSILVAIYSEMGKENKLTCRTVCMYLFYKNNKKRNETK